MTDVARLIVSSKSSHKYIQPHYEWAENITSHRISRQSFIDLLDTYKPTEHRVCTTYHDTDIVYTDILYCSTGIRTSTCHIKYHQEEIAIDNLEYIGENMYDLSVTRFSPALNYHHERQSVQLIKDNSRFTMILEILIPHIVRPDNINTNAIVDKIVKETSDDIISLSYRFIIKNITTKELTDQLSVLKDATKPVNLIEDNTEEKEEKEED